MAEYIEREVLTDLLYAIRTHMTPITRYVKHDILKHPELTTGQFIERNIKYKSLASKAVDDILNYINGDNITIKFNQLADVAPVVHGRWKYYHKQNKAVCTNCSFERDLDANFGKAISCPNCWAKMDAPGINVGG